MAYIYETNEYATLHNKFTFELENDPSIAKIKDRFERIHQLTINHEGRIKALGKIVIASLEEYEQAHGKNLDKALELMSEAQDKWQLFQHYAAKKRSLEQLEEVEKSAVKMLNQCLSLLPQTWLDWNEMSKLVDALCVRAAFYFMTTNFKPAYSDCRHATTIIWEHEQPQTIRDHFQNNPEVLVKLMAIELGLLRYSNCRTQDIVPVLDSLHLTGDIKSDLIDSRDDKESPTLEQLFSLQDKLMRTFEVDLFLKNLKKLKLFIDKREKRYRHKNTKQNNFWINEKLRLESSRQGGRFYVADRYIAKSECITVERPCSSVIFHEQISKYCTNCSRPLVTAWPCSKCDEVFFCDVNCARRAYNNFHRYECGIYGYILSRDNFYSVPHAFRFYAQFGVQCAVKTELADPESLALDVLTTNYLMDPVMRGESLHNMNTQQREMLCRAIFSLLSHRDKRDIKREVSHTLISYGIAYILKHRGVLDAWLGDETQPGHIPVLQLSQLCECLATCMLRTATNGFCWASSAATPGCNEENMRIASCLCFVSSFMNHSCSPNVVWTMDNEGIRMHAMRDIEPGEPLTICYGPRHSVAFEQRQKRLKNDYLFFCLCDLCRVDSAAHDQITLHCLARDDCQGPLVMNRFASCLACGQQSGLLPKQIKNLLASKKRALKSFNRSIAPLLIKPPSRFLLTRIACLPFMLHGRAHCVYKPNKNYHCLLLDGDANQIQLGVRKKFQKSNDFSPRPLVFTSFVADRFRVEQELSAKEMQKTDNHYSKYAHLAYPGSYQLFSMIADMAYLNHRHDRDEHSLSLLARLSRCLRELIPSEFGAPFTEHLARLEFVSVYLTHLATHKLNMIMAHYGDNVPRSAAFWTTTKAVNAKLLAILRHDLNERGHFFPQMHKALKTRASHPPPLVDSSGGDLDESPDSEPPFPASEERLKRMMEHCQLRLCMLDSIAS